MTGLLDIAPVAAAQIDVFGASVDVFGLSAEALAVLATRFPSLRQLILGGSVDIAAIMASGPEAVAAIVAAGCGYHKGDDAAQAEALAARMPAEAQALAILAIVQATTPSGPGPFVEKVVGRLREMGLWRDPPTEATPTDAESPSSSSS